MRRLIARGFTLIEMIMVVVLLAVTSIAVATMVAQVGSGQSENSDMQVGAQLLQECGEWIVSNHRRDKSFYNGTLGTGSASCYGLTTYQGFAAPSVVVSAYVGDGCPKISLGAPADADCKLAAISISRAGATLNTVNVVLVRYNPT